MTGPVIPSRSGQPGYRGVPGVGAGADDPEVPYGIDPTGVPGARSGLEAFILTLAVVVALLGLIVTLGWVVFYHLTAR
ncbi:MAG: hypothetical protein ACR2KG_04555 [Nocardioidaceae bacterium]